MIVAQGFDLGSTTTVIAMIVGLSGLAGGVGSALYVFAKRGQLREAIETGKTVSGEYKALADARKEQRDEFQNELAEVRQQLKESQQALMVANDRLAAIEQVVSVTALAELNEKLDRLVGSRTRSKPKAKARR